jgi:hypothetical protein
MFSIYALLGQSSPGMSAELLAAHLKGLFRNEEGFSLQFEKLPFWKDPSLALRWRTWFARVCYEEGKRVADDSAEIARILGSAAPAKLAAIDKRIRVVFGDDDAHEYTNQMIDLMDFLCRIDGAIVFDPRQKDIVNSAKPAAPSIAAPALAASTRPTHRLHWRTSS